MTAIILDTETTGLDEPEVIQLAFRECSIQFAYEPVQQFLFKPSKPISLGAMATHHIIADDLSDSPPWPGSWQIPIGIEYLIGHNVDFDWKAIGSPDVKRICTLALARSVWPDLDSHSLGAVLFHVLPAKVARDNVRQAHSADADVRMTIPILYELWRELGQPASWADMWEISEKARIPTHFTFGKYGPKDGQKGTPIAEVRKFDRGYIKWCLTSCDIVTGDPYWQKALTQ